MNYASRSDMQRERARERLERARRQWELEHSEGEEGGGQMGNNINADQDSGLSFPYKVKTSCRGRGKPAWLVTD